MGYQAPSLEALRRVAEDLKRDYKGCNAQRYSYILLLEKIIEQTYDLDSAEKARNILVGAIIFELELINSGRGRYLYNHSAVYAQLCAILKADKRHNPLYDSERFVYLTAFYEHVSTKISETTMQSFLDKKTDFTWRDEAALIHAIVTNLKVIRDRDLMFHGLVHAAPRVNALQQNTYNLCQNYRQEMSAKHNTERVKLINFIEFVHYASDFLYEEEFKTIPEMYHIEREARRGLILFVLLTIENEYRYMPRFISPSGGKLNAGSKLYKEGLEALNLNKLSDLSAAEKSKLLVALKDRIDKIEFQCRKNPELKAYLSSNKVVGFEIDATVKSQLEAYQKDQKRMEIEPKGTSAVVSSFAGYTAQTGAKTAMSLGVGEYAVKGVLGLAAMGIAGPAGVAGLAALDWIATMVTDSIVSTITASLYGWLIERLGSSISAKTADQLASQYSISDDGIKRLREQLNATNPEEERQFCEWVNALLTTPETVVSEADKDSIRHVFGIDRSSDLKPLSPHTATAELTMATIRYA